MQDGARLSDDMIRRFGIRHAKLVAETQIARIFFVHTAVEGIAALKVYHRADMGNERTGVAFMDAVKGRGAVRIFDYSENAVLMEWLDGPSLGDVARNGRDMQAAERLLDVARTLHENRSTVSGSLAPLTEWFEPIFAVQFSQTCPAGLQANIGRAQRLAQSLLSGPMDLRPLHGDLHHENVRSNARGDLSFDAKGLLGDPAFELANAFRHPADRPALVRDRARINALAELWARGFGVSRGRLLEWAAAKCALSIVWRNGPVLAEDDESDLLHLLLSCAGAEPKKRAEH